MKNSTIIICICFLLGLIPSVHAQRIELGVNWGASAYIGELNPDKIFKPSGMNMGVFGRVNFDPHWSVGLHLNMANIKGDDLDFPANTFSDPMVNFNTRIYEVSSIAQFNFIDMYSPGKKSRWTPFIFAGLGGILFNPTVEGSRGKVDAESDYYASARLNSYGNYKNYAVVIPFGAGLKYKQTERWTWQGSFGYRHVFNDYLDVYSDKNSYISNVGTAESRKRDAYLFVNIGISYTFVSPKCFTF